MYRRLGRIDRARSVTSWSEALAWLGAQDESIDELQYWGHGHWGRVLVDGEALDAGWLAPSHARAGSLAAVRERIAPGALVWLRTCETFGGAAGHDFAARLADWSGARVAGHTYIIGVNQSGLHGLAPGMQPTWSASEGIARGTLDAPERAKRSRPWAPHTITCFDGAIPAAWFGSSDPE